MPPRHRTRVQTVPVWAKDLPADDYSDDDAASYLRQPEAAYSTHAVQRSGGTTSSTVLDPTESGAAEKCQDHDHDRWYSFAVSSRYIDKVQGYLANNDHNGSGSSEDSSEAEDARSVRSALRTSRPATGTSDVEKNPRRKRYRRRQRRRSSTNTQAATWSNYWTALSNNREPPFDPFTHSQETRKPTGVYNFVLHNPFAPLVIRAINLCLNTAIMAVACHMRYQEHRRGILNIVGNSTLFAIVSTPLTAVHIFVNIYLEYFGKPPGVWAVARKMAYTLIELLFICVWSANLSLSFDNLFTTVLECSSYSPDDEYLDPATDIQDEYIISSSLATSLCNQQIAQIVLISLHIWFEAGLLVISLLRLFQKTRR